MSFLLTERQEQANLLLASDSTHCMLYGGSRSGKTFLIVRAIVARALRIPSRHAILRFRFSHVIDSVALDTLPKVLQLCWPELAHLGHLDKSRWFYELPSGEYGKGRSEIWFGGLDEKERTEKILGNEYSSIYLNECSMIPLASRTLALTRLAQNSGLTLKAYYDCNPPGRSHWTHKLFIEKMDPERRTRLAHPLDYNSMRLNPTDNRRNLPVGYIENTLENLPERSRQRFLLGDWASETESALWTPELLDDQRIMDGALPEFQRIIIAVDPSGCAGEQDKRSDEVGIVVVGLGTDQRGYVLEDLSGHHGPREWGHVVAGAYDRHKADCVVAETNYGGAMVGEILRSARPGTPYREVKATTRGKVVRAEPVAFLWQQAKVSLVGRFPILEDQLCGMTTAGYIGDKSPDRADAMVWGLTELFPALAKADKPIDGILRQSQANVGYATVKKYASAAQSGRQQTANTSRTGGREWS